EVCGGLGETSGVYPRLQGLGNYMMRLRPVASAMRNYSSAAKEIEREGKDITITGLSKMVGYALKVC
ncbi:hypothetical protein M8C21_028247, partial [Ambrosia artemisiifolia]